MNRLSLSLLVAFLLALAPAQAAFLVSEPPVDATSPLGDRATDRYMAGREALRNNDMATAEQAFKDAITANPRMPQARIGLADVALRRGAREQAKSFLDEALAIAPKDDSVHHALALFHSAGQDYPAAQVALEKALEINPDNLGARNDLANLYATALKRPSDAVTAYRAVLEIDPSQVPARLGLAQSLAATGQFTAAETELVTAAKAQPDSPIPPHALARLQLGRGKADAGLAALDAALNIQPDFVPALLDKGDVLLGAGKPEEALALYDRAVAAQEKNATAHFKRGTVLQMQKRNVEAKQAYVTVISLDNAFAPAYNNLAWMQTESRDNLDQGSQWAATAVNLAPDNAAFRDTQGWVYRTQRKLAEAETVLEKAATMQPPIADVQYHLGMVYLEQKKPDQARQAFNKALAIDPKHAEATAALRQLGGTASQ